MRTRLCVIVSILLISLAPRAGAATFHVSSKAEAPSGRLVVFLVRDGSGIDPKTQPMAGPFWSKPQPMYGIDVTRASALSATLNDSATSFPEPPSKLAAGVYRAQAALIAHHDTGNWRHEAGNWFSDPVAFTVAAGTSQQIELTLSHQTTPLPEKTDPAVSIVRVRSKLLSDFHHRDVYLTAGVVHPLDEKQGEHYPAVYEVPGFGGTANAAFAHAAQRAKLKDPDELELARRACWIVIDPEWTNGHTLLCNSDNNGPWGDAVVNELIPALETKFPLISSPHARVIRGHSSGGWSALWLATQYPQTFGACWAISPDPVDFHHLMRLNIYDFENAFVQNGHEVSTVRDGKATVRQENAIEEVLGPRNSSGEQWDSWQAAWGTRDAAGHVAALFDPVTGQINRAEAESYKRFDFVDLVKRDAQKYRPLFRQKIHILAGDRDTYYLNEAVESLKQTLGEADGAGITIAAGFTHGSILSSPQAKLIPREMLKVLQGG